jgi:transposase
MLDSVVIGADPHKHSVTIEVIDAGEQVLHKGRYGTDLDGYRQMLTAARRFAHRRWAVEGCNGIGRHVAQRLVADGETVVDVPAKLAARARVFDTGNGRKTDPADAHSVAVVALRTAHLNMVRPDDDLVALRLLVDRRDELARTRTQTVNRLHRLLLEIIPGGAKRFLSAAQAQALLNSAVPAHVAGRVRHQLASELLEEIVNLDQKIKTSDRTLKQAVAATGTGLLELRGIGPVSAARILADVADVARFATRARFASWNGTAPLEASSGEQRRHRLSRAGNRRINRALHIMAIVQIRHDTEGRAYFRRRVAGGKTKMEALRALKRRLSDVVYRQLVADARQAASPGGHLEATTTSRAADPTPTVGSSDKSQPGLTGEPTATGSGDTRTTPAAPAPMRPATRPRRSARTRPAAPAADPGPCAPVDNRDVPAPPQHPAPDRR